jgi:hypothetical protein
MAMDARTCYMRLKTMIYPRWNMKWKLFPLVCFMEVSLLENLSPSSAIETSMVDLLPLIVSAWHMGSTFAIFCDNLVVCSSGVKVYLVSLGLVRGYVWIAELGYQRLPRISGPSNVDNMKTCVCIRMMSHILDLVLPPIEFWDPPPLRHTKMC